MSATRLSSLPDGTSATIVKVEPSGADTLVRLQQMGLVPGAELKLLRRAPFGGPIEVFVCRSRLCLRRHDAHGIFVTTTPSSASLGA